MAAQLDEKLLESRLASLESARAWSPRVVSKLESHIRTGDDADVFRINPIGFAADKGIAEPEAIDLFLHATALGLFQMNWLLLCPLCSGVVESFQELKGVHSHYICKSCVCDFEAKLDEFITVTFTVNPAIRETKYHHPERLPAGEYFFEYRSNPDGLLPDGTPIVDSMGTMTRHVAYLEGGEAASIAVEAVPGGVFGISHDAIPDLLYLVDGAPAAAPQAAEIIFGPDYKERQAGMLAPGVVNLSIRNATDARGAFLVMVVPPELSEGPPDLTFKPFLSGKRLLTTQTFRDLFRSEVIESNEGIGVTDITLLFTDLKGSTALYDRIGDLNAFSLVQQHFDKLQDVSIRNSGAVIKTIGDAVMAAFMAPDDAVRAAIGMLEEIHAFNQGQPNRELVLKIGIHKGAAIAVTLNDRLDYFGQTVNIAARVQGLADADEIYLSEDVFASAGVDGALAGADTERQVASLRGVQGDLTVFRVRHALAAGG